MSAFIALNVVSVCCVARTAGSRWFRGVWGRVGDVRGMPQAVVGDVRGVPQAVVGDVRGVTLACARLC